MTRATGEREDGERGKKEEKKNKRRERKHSEMQHPSLSLFAQNLYIFHLYLVFLFMRARLWLSGMCLPGFIDGFHPRSARFLTKMCPANAKTRMAYVSPFHLGTRNTLAPDLSLPLENRTADCQAPAYIPARLAVRGRSRWRRRSVSLGALTLWLGPNTTISLMGSSWDVSLGRAHPAMLVWSFD